MKRPAVLASIICTLGFAVPGAASAADSVAMITELQGKADSGGAALSLLAELPAGAHLTLADGAKLTLVFLADGKEFLLAGPAQIAVEAAQARVLSGAAPKTRTLLAASDGDIKIVPAKVAQAAVVMRAGTQKEQDLHLISPVDTRIMGIHPTFSWKPAGDGTSYRLTVLDDGGTEYYSTVTYQTSTFLPDEIELPIGTPLVWELEARVGAQTLFASAEFEILDNDWRRAINNSRPDDDADFPRRLFYARLLESAGLVEDAKKAWREILAERPDDPVLREAANR